MTINVNPFYKGQAQARRAMSGPGPRATDARLKAMREANKIPGIRVEAVSEEKRSLKHVPTGRRLRATGSTEWPNDRFTQRRLADGDIKLAEEKLEHADEKPAPTGQHGRHGSRGHASE
jgi:hypothetical protein